MMSRLSNQDFLPMLARFPESLQANALWLRDWIWELFPEANELIYDKANALAIGWGLSDKSSDIFVSFAVYTKHINLGLHQGNLLHDPQHLLEGTGKEFRHYRIGTMESFPRAYMEQLMQASCVNALTRQKPSKTSVSGKTLIKQSRG